MDFDELSKRVSRPPNRFGYDYLSIDNEEKKKKMSQTTSTTTSPALSTLTTSTTSVTTSSSGSGRVMVQSSTNDPVKTSSSLWTAQTKDTSSHESPNISAQIQSMLSQLARMELQSNKQLTNLRTDITTKIDQQSSEIIAFRKSTEEHMSKCTETWSTVDTRITKLEDSQIRVDQQFENQFMINTEVSTKILNLEREIISMKNIQDSGHCSTSPNTVLPGINPPCLSSTHIPERSVHFSMPAGHGTYETTSNNVNNTSVAPNNFDSMMASYCGRYDRLNDAVSEFSGSVKDLHPEKFLSQLDTYFDTVPLSPTRQLISAQRRLSGNALIWYESLIPTPQTYNEFRAAFRDYFWSPAIQRKARNDIFRPYRYNNPNGLASHAMQWISGAKYINPPIDQVDLVSTIIQHYPTALGMAIRATRPPTINDLLSVLNEFEESTSFCEVSRHNFGNNQQYNRSNSSSNRPNQNSDLARPPYNRGEDSPRNNHSGNRPNINNNRPAYRGNFNRPPAASRENIPVNNPVHEVNVSGNADEARP